jgi:hypothetical protein
LRSIASSDASARCLVPHDLPEQRDLFYLGWCHGPAGTGRFLYELSAVTNDSDWKTFANAAADSVIHSGVPEKQTPGYWNNLSRCCGAVALGEFFLCRYRLTNVAEDRAFAIRIGEYLRSRAETDGAGLKWVQAENRIEPDNLQAQTGIMQGAAGIGLFFIHLSELDGEAETAIRFPDSPWQDLLERASIARLAGRKSRRAADGLPIYRLIAPDLRRVVWLGSCRTSPIEVGPGNLNRSSNEMALDRA